MDTIRVLVGCGVSCIAPSPGEQLQSTLGFLLALREQRIVLLLPCGQRLSSHRTLAVPAPNTDGYAAAACQFPGVLRGLIGDLSSARRSRVAKHPSGLNLRLLRASFLFRNWLAPFTTSPSLAAAIPSPSRRYSLRSEWLRSGPGFPVKLAEFARQRYYGRSDFSPTPDALPLRLSPSSSPSGCPPLGESTSSP